MVKHEEIKRRLIESAVHVVARDGLDKTTTKAISKDSGLNEVYIYREFENKEDLLRAALNLEDRRFVYKVFSSLPVMHDADLDWKERCYRLWKPVWEFVIGIPDDCLFYIRYYYSANFRQYAMEEHLACFRRIVRVAEPVFKRGVNILVLMHQLFETLLSYASRVMEGFLKDDEDSCRIAFNQIYYFVVPHIREDVVNGAAVSNYVSDEIRRQVKEEEKRDPLV